MYCEICHADISESEYFSGKCWSCGGWGDWEMKKFRWHIIGYKKDPNSIIYAKNIDDAAEVAQRVAKLIGIENAVIEIEICKT